MRGCRYRYRKVGFTSFQFARLENVLKSDEAKGLLDEALDPSSADFGAGLIEMLSNAQPGLEPPGTNVPLLG